MISYHLSKRKSQQATLLSLETEKNYVEESDQ